MRSCTRAARCARSTTPPGCAPSSRLTRTQEDNRAHPWQVADAPADYIDQMLRAIVGIEVEVVTLEAKWKVSQNRGVFDRVGVAGGLRAEGTDAARALAAMVPIER
jgi:transcriptional regulator